MGYFGDVDVVVGLDVEAQQHLFVERNLGLGVGPTNGLPEGFGYGESTEHVESELASDVIGRLDIERLIAPADLN